ncbi:class Ib ribonucleoside-diphosphate reductase assembly flavoprotein NrdI [Neomegalonema sp.]|uniref:class Ib ribonucleoside-diphosphate reductase assembly flavoprotein NrdI n=1 Tax=Neomegalonema sp. TaxID=2039713 RepID=UPI00261F9C01|nr:class Ib ribonucleoside-diphosphate reductase assembly flavoprotein NrdI [Neomegalonema sp.]MDD2868499.1 class Ib ribonucleoside-diphosphate reductase assembly flavoprotein NrdI [Neomegalonema sp.]
MEGLVYFSSATGNTRRFVERLGERRARPALRILGGPLSATAPFVLICPSYGDGEGRGSVPKPVIRFLNDPANRALLRGVIGAGNRNFGHLFAHAGGVVAEKCGVPLLYRFELAGTGTDIDRVDKGLEEFWTRLRERA